MRTPERGADCPVTLGSSRVAVKSRDGAAPFAAQARSHHFEFPALSFNLK